MLPNTIPGAMKRVLCFLSEGCCELLQSLMQEKQIIENDTGSTAGGMTA